MTIDINELRMVLARHGTSVLNKDKVLELLDRLEAAEKERDDITQQLVQSEISKREISEAHSTVTQRLSVLADENTTLRAKVEEMERQEPYCTAIGPGDWTYQISSPARPGSKLYALPGAQPEMDEAGLWQTIANGMITPAHIAQPAPSAPKLHVGNLPTINQDDYPALGAWWIQLWDGDSVFARVYGASPEEAYNRASMLAASPEAKP